MSKHGAQALGLTLLIALVAAACMTGRPSQPVTSGRAMTDGETIGEPARPAAGLATPTGVRTLLAAGCQDGALIVRTNVEKIIAGMDCSKAEPAARYQPFLDQVVAITYTNGRLRLENPTAGALEIPVQNAKVYGSDATP